MFSSLATKKSESAMWNYNADGTFGRCAVRLPFTLEHVTAKHVKDGRAHDMAKLLQELCRIIFKGEKH
jgi:hypothetical protein